MKKYIPYLYLTFNIIFIILGAICFIKQYSFYGAILIIISYLIITYSRIKYQNKIINNIFLIESLLLFVLVIFILFWIILIIIGFSKLN